MLPRLNRWLDQFFPPVRPLARTFKVWQLIALPAGLTLLFSLLGYLVPPGGMIGFDWVHFFGVGRIPEFYPPWTQSILSFFTWPLLIGVTLAGFTLAVIKRAVHPISAAAGFLCLPLLWTILIGQLEGIVVFGLLGIPWLAPLVLVKPQVSVFAFLAHRKFMLVLLLFFILSLFIWGFWPAQMLAVETYYAEGRYPQNIGLGLWGLPLAILLFWFSRGDMDLLMLSGAFLIPHLIPYNLLPVVPAVARLRPRHAWIAAFLSWLPFTANWIGPLGWWLGWFFVLWLWVQVFRVSCPERIFRLIHWLRDRFIPAAK